MDCKLALQESNFDIEKALEYLRKKGVAAARKRHGRDTSEGLIALQIQENKGALVALYSETDFVARNATFQNLAKNLASLALDNFTDLESFSKTPYPSSQSTVAEEIANNISTTGENIALKQVTVLSVGQGAILHYVHSPIAANLGKIGVLVALESAAPKTQLQELGKNLAMQIAATKPDALSIETLDKRKIEKERDIIAEQVRRLNKPDNISAKMIEGRLKKYFADAVLLEQACIADNKITVRELIAATEKQLGESIRIAGYRMLILGEHNALYTHG